MAIYKNGNWESQFLSNYFLKYNKKPVFIAEPDGSVWLQIVHHNNPAENLFNSTDDFTSGVYLDTNRWFYVNLCSYFSSWELMIKQKENNNETEKRYRWTQLYNPMLATFEQTMAADVVFNTTSRYTIPAVVYGGLWCKNTSSYLVANNNNSGNWWGAVGCWTNYQGGIPGYDGKLVTNGYMDLYIRITKDNLNDINKTYITNNNYLFSKDFWEI